MSSKKVWKKNIKTYFKKYQAQSINKKQMDKPFKQNNSTKTKPLKTYTTNQSNSKPHSQTYGRK